MLVVTPIPLLADNYAYFLEDEASGQTGVVDPSQAQGVLDFLIIHNRPLHFILNTHHHPDHTGGNLALKAATGAQVVGFQGDRHRLPGLDIPVGEKEILHLGGSTATILFIPGHTRGHIAYHFAEDKILFTGDTLFSLGCGRLFEGSPKDMWASLQKIARLPDETQIYCGHEYTLANFDFATSLFPKDAALQREGERLRKKRQNSLPTVPSLLGFEKRFNPFLLFQKRPCEVPLSDEEIFALRRRLKDNF